MADAAAARRRHYRFGGTAFRSTIAHAGIGQIHTCRVEDGAAIGAANFLDLTIMPSGSSIGVHTHGPGDEEIYIVISGSGRMQLEQEEFTVGPGDVIVNNRRGTHGLVNTGPGELRLVVVEIPAARLEPEGGV